MTTQLSRSVHLAAPTRSPVVMLLLVMCKICSIDDGGRGQPARSYSAYGCLVVMPSGTLTPPPCHNGRWCHSCCTDMRH